MCNNAMDHNHVSGHRMQRDVSKKASAHEHGHSKCTGREYSSDSMPNLQYPHDQATAGGWHVLVRHVPAGTVQPVHGPSQCNHIESPSWLLCPRFRSRSMKCCISIPTFTSRCTQRWSVHSPSSSAFASLPVLNPKPRCTKNGTSAGPRMGA